MKSSEFIGRGASFKLQLLQLFVTCVATIQPSRCKHYFTAIKSTCDNKTRKGPKVIIWLGKVYLGVVGSNALDYSAANSRAQADSQSSSLPGTLQSAHTSAFRSRLDILGPRGRN